MSHAVNCDDTILGDQSKRTDSPLAQKLMILHMTFILGHRLAKRSNDTLAALLMTIHRSAPLNLRNYRALKIELILIHQKLII
jgi:hypothetical protein